VPPRCRVNQQRPRFSRRQLSRRRGMSARGVGQRTERGLCVVTTGAGRGPTVASDGSVACSASTTSRCWASRSPRYGCYARWVGHRGSNSTLPRCQSNALMQLCSCRLSRSSPPVGIGTPSTRTHTQVGPMPMLGSANTRGGAVAGGDGARQWSAMRAGSAAVVAGGVDAGLRGALDDGATSPSDSPPALITDARLCMSLAEPLLAVSTLGA